MSKNDLITTTTRFKELKDKFNSDLHAAANTVYGCTTEYKITVLIKTMNEMLTLLDEMVKN